MRTTAADSSTARPRSRDSALALAVLAGGSVLVLVSYGATWETAEVAVFAGSGPSASTTVTLTGRDLAPLGAAAGLVGLAGVAGILATRRWGRRIVGAVVALAGGVAGAIALTFGFNGAAFAEAALAGRGIDPALVASAASSAQSTPWWIAAVAGGLAMLVAGLLAIARATRWPVLSSRYQREGGTSRGAPRGGDASPDAGPADGPVGGIAAWDALDRGEDPTDPRGGAG
ncbi:MAG: Trp biosynthesis-associated membrane protein [bacterium]